MSGASETPASADPPPPAPALVELTAPLSAGTAPSGSVSTSSDFKYASPAYSAARERVRRQLDEIHANILAERQKAKSLATVSPLLETPLIPLVPSQHFPPTIAPSIETEPHEEPTTTPSSPELAPTKNPRECPCGQLFSRPEHVLRHRARNICAAGLDRPGEPKRKIGGGMVSKAKPSNDVKGAPAEATRDAKLTPSTTPKPVSSATRGGSTGSRVTRQPDPLRQARAPSDTSSPRYRCECGRGFGHSGNYDRHRNSGKCQDRNEATEAKVAPVRVVARSDTVCECGKWYTHSHSLLRHIKQNLCDYGDPKATLATLSSTSPTSTAASSSASSDRHTPADSRLTGEKRSRGPDDSIDEKVSKKVHSSVSDASSPPAYRASKLAAKKLLAEDAGSEGETVISTGTKSSRTQSVA